jgi:STE24 endopeptidase
MDRADPIAAERRTGRGPSRRTIAIAAVLVLALVAVLAGVLVPWGSVYSGSASPAGDFTAAEIARGQAYRSSVRPWSDAALLAGLAALVVLGLTSLGARLVAGAARPLGGGFWARVAVGGPVILLVVALVRLPFQARVESLAADAGLSTRGWDGFLADLARSWALQSLLAAAALGALFGLARWLPRWWWAVASVGAAVLVAVVSYAYPVVVEPLFNDFEPMAAGPLRDDLLALAERDGVAVGDVLVADASRRGTALNAYVSGFGGTRRIVVYDTLLDEAPTDQVRAIVAHELGHASAGDVPVGTLLAAVAAAAATLGVALVLTWPAALRRAGVGSAADPRAAALALATVSLLAVLATPAESAISRALESRADRHALDLAEQPEAFIAIQRRLASANLADLDPPAIRQWFFGTHPTAPERIAAARAWAAERGLPAPPGALP